MNASAHKRVFTKTTSRLCTQTRFRQNKFSLVHMTFIIFLLYRMNTMNLFHLRMEMVTDSQLRLSGSVKV